jgi:hypothetical protein
VRPRPRVVTTTDSGPAPAMLPAGRAAPPGPTSARTGCHLPLEQPGVPDKASFPPDEKEASGGHPVGDPSTSRWKRVLTDATVAATRSG